MSEAPTGSALTRNEMRELDRKAIEELGIPSVCLMELAGLFHPYYNRNRVVTDDAGTTAARLLLLKAVGTVASNGLRLLGVSTPEKM